jgi:hypothetical protein
MNESPAKNAPMRAVANKQYIGDIATPAAPSSEMRISDHLQHLERMVTAMQAALSELQHQIMPVLLDRPLGVSETAPIRHDGQSQLAGQLAEQIARIETTVTFIQQLTKSVQL